MKCPQCGNDQAYVGLLKVECVNEHCPNYDYKYAATVQSLEAELEEDIGNRIAQSMWQWRENQGNSTD